MHNTQHISPVRRYHACYIMQASGYVINNNLKNPYPSARYKAFMDYPVNEREIYIAAAITLLSLIPVSILNAPLTLNEPVF